MPDPDELNDALLRADLWRVLALAFGPPSGQSLSDLQGLCDELASALDPVRYPFRDGLTELAQSIASLERISLEHEYNALFSMDVMVPAYEGSYQRIERGSVVGDIAGYYKAFELSTTDQSGPPDSLWNECAFLSWLSLKEGFALEYKMEEELAVTREAMREFLQDHLGRWAGAFTRRLLLTTENPFFVTAAHLLLAAVSMTADKMGVSEIEPLDVREQENEPEPVACPMGARCST